MFCKKYNIHLETILTALAAATIAFILTAPASATSLIRDAEIEHTLHSISEPIFKAAGVNPSSVKIFIVQDDTLNAYVAGGQNIFINTGLIIESGTPDVLMGVIAHETGHIAGGHLARGTEQLKNAQIGSIITFVLSAGAVVTAKNTETGAAILTGGQNAIMKNLLAFTRANEQAADQSAANSLDKLGISAQGLIKMFEILRRNERSHPSSPDPYMLTHPLTNERIDFLREHTQKSKIPVGQYPKKYLIPHQRMIAKLYGFIKSPEQTMQKYPRGDKSVPARLARAIAYYKTPDVQSATIEMNSLIEEYPDDPFFHELKGQILFENNIIGEALREYQTAAKLLPNSPLILADLAKVELAQDLLSTIKPAIAHLEKSTTIDNSNPQSWRLLATAYGKAGNTPMSYLALAEEALLNADSKTAIQMANQAINSLKYGSPAHRRAEDIKALAIEMKKDEKSDTQPF